jgi:hypothetical protein
MSRLNGILDWLLRPVTGLIRILFKAVASLFPNQRYSIAGPEEGPED